MCLALCRELGTNLPSIPFLFPHFQQPAPLSPWHGSVKRVWDSAELCVCLENFLSLVPMAFEGLLQAHCLKNVFPEGTQTHRKDTNP